MEAVGLGDASSRVISVVPSPKVVLDVSPLTPAQTCTDAKIYMQAVDSSGNPMPAAIVPEVTLCKPADRSASLVTSSLTLASDTPDCITGSFTGSAVVVWTDRVAEDDSLHPHGHPHERVPHDHLEAWAART